jgi:hypothetical protein
MPVGFTRSADTGPDEISRYDEQGWRATFYTGGMEHSLTSTTGTAWEQTAWRAVHRAAWDALKRT